MQIACRGDLLEQLVIWNNLKNGPILGTERIKT